MTYEQIIDLFIKAIEKIQSLNPAYKQPGKGDDGTCDCIGLIIGAIIRIGLKWLGIHGSNYAARFDIEDLQPIKSEADLERGDIIFKGCTQASKPKTYALPSRYKKGGAYYTGDLTDYYHVGVVLSVKPLRIIHMTSPRMRVDTKLDQNKNSIWGFHGKSKTLLKAVGKAVTPSKPINEPIATTGSVAVVVATTGNNVFLRQYPDKNCRTWERVPVGSKVTIVEPGEVWAKVNYGKRKGWYMKSEFLDIVGDGKGKY